MFKNSNLAKIKLAGQVYTPNNIVKLMLDFVGYRSNGIIEKHIIDNSAGDGAFLKEIVIRYINAYIGSFGNNIITLKKHLETYIHGIEIDKDEYQKCINNLNAIAYQYGIENVDWDILNLDALDTSVFDGKMDYVVGNPPYIRIHNLYKNGQIENVKRFKFFSGGMSDLYIIF
ncbi:MAG: N-6 DNA methylase, partial [Candidatus Aenigmatarchaeota archaeon]